MTSVAQSAATTTLTIGGRDYLAYPIDPHEEGTHAVRICKGDGNVYDVVREPDGILRCDCPHYELRLRGNTRTPCKHGAALVAAGLLPAPGVDMLAGSPLSDRDIWLNGPRVEPEEVAIDPTSQHREYARGDDYAHAGASPAAVARRAAELDGDARAAFLAGHAAAGVTLAGCRIDHADGLPVDADEPDDEEIDEDMEDGDDPDDEPFLPPPGEPRLPLGEWVGMQAAWYRSFGTEAADLCAFALDELAGEIGLLKAGSVESYFDRRAALLGR